MTREKIRIKTKLESVDGFERLERPRLYQRPEGRDQGVTTTGRATDTSSLFTIDVLSEVSPGGFPVSLYYFQIPGEIVQYSALSVKLQPLKNSLTGRDRAPSCLHLA